MARTQNNSNRAGEIFRDLRRRIMSGELPIGARLPPERELAGVYNTNRNTLREAIRKLEHSRLVSVRHGQGVTVSDFRRTGTIELLGAFFEHVDDLTEKASVLRDLLPGRTKMVCFALEVAAARADDHDVGRLQDLASLVKSAQARGDNAAAILAFQRFMDVAVDAAHSVPIRWIANSFLDAERELFAVNPALWLPDPQLPEFLDGFLARLEKGDAAGLVQLTQDYYARTDEALWAVLNVLLAGDANASQPKDAETLHLHLAPGWPAAGHAPRLEVFSHPNTF